MRLLLLMLALSGCTAGRASLALVQANSAITRAREAGAEEHAPYELTMAEAYLTKAREEASFSSYKDAVELSRGSADWADRAIIAMETAGTGRSASAPDAVAPEEAPAPAVAPEVQPEEQAEGTAEEPVDDPAEAPAPPSPTPDVPTGPAGGPSDPGRIVVPLPEGAPPEAPRVIIVPVDDPETADDAEPTNEESP